MEEVKRNSLRAWILAARPKTLTGAITPVMIGSALAYMDGHFQWLPALICCLFAGLMQIAANFIYDLLSDRICAAVLGRMGADHSRTSLRTLRFPLYHRPLSIILQRLGRCSGHRIFRIRPRGRNVLRAGADMDFGHNGSFSDLRTAD